MLLRSGKDKGDEIVADKLKKRAVKNEYSSEDEPPLKRQRRKPLAARAKLSPKAEVKGRASITKSSQGKQKAKKKRTAIAETSEAEQETKASKVIEEEVKQGDPQSPLPQNTSAKTPVRSTAETDHASAEESSCEEDSLSSDEDEKPEAAAKAREKVQITLKNSGKDPYPDWKAGDPVPYAALCTTFSKIEMTTKRLEILAHCSLFLRQVLRLTPNDLLPTIQLMINKLAADYAGIELGIGESLIMKAIGESTGRSLSIIKADQNEIGDLGLVAAKSRSNQPTMFKPKALTVRGVQEGLMGIATVEGQGSQGRKVAGIKKLLSAADAHLAGKGGKGVDITKDKGGPSEAKYIVRTLEGKLRLGLAEKTVLVALAQAMVFHETTQNSDKIPSTEQLAKGERILKSVYR
jgi:DNA ligase 1